MRGSIWKTVGNDRVETDYEEPGNEEPGNPSHMLQSIWKTVGNDRVETDYEEPGNSSHILQTARWTPPWKEQD